MLFSPNVVSDNLFIEDYYDCFLVKHFHHNIRLLFRWMVVWSRYACMVLRINWNWLCSLHSKVQWSIRKILDNLDGWQARKTGNSSPLGCILDHGSDSVTVVVSTINMTRIMAPGNNLLCILAQNIGTFPFFFAHVEAYFIGGVFLPEINGISEGSFVYMAICLHVAIFGNGPYTGHTFHEEWNNSCVIGFIAIWVMGLMVLSK